MQISKELLKQCLIGAEQAHAALENATGKKHTDWPEFYANFMFARLQYAGPGVGFDDLEYAVVDGGLMGPAYCASPKGRENPGCDL